MTSEVVLDRIKKHVSNGHYRVRIHAVRHMIEEGFGEQDMVNAILGDSRIIEPYEDDARCLILGFFLWNGKIRSPLHVVLDYSNKKVTDIVTAYIPQRPWWISPTKRGTKI